MKKFLHDGSKTLALHEIATLLEISDELYDVLAQEVLEEIRYLEEQEEAWKASLGHTYKTMLEENVVTEKEANEIRRQYLLAEYEQSLRNKQETRKIESEYKSRFVDHNQIQANLIEKAKNTDISKIIHNEKRMICCPFHKERTPSMSITKNVFHCFGCGKSGDAITFAKEYLNLNFKDAVLYLVSL